MDFKKKIILAPMADITSSPFRLLCKDYGADIVFSEMVSVNGIVRNNKSTMKHLEFDNKERPIAVQLLGCRTEIVAKAAKKVVGDFDFIDFNMGCPATKVLKQGAGAALLRRKNKVKEILSELVKLDKPITVKIRTGFDKEQSFALEIGKVCEDVGVSALTVHARTVAQAYSGKADWSIIKEMKENLDIPVIGNGDIWCAEDAKNMFKETNCDSVMVGRGAIGNPFIFREIKSLLFENKKIKEVRLDERLDAWNKIKDQMDFISARKHLLQFVKDFKGAKKIRNELANIKNPREFDKIIKNIKNINL